MYLGTHSSNKQYQAQRTRRDNSTQPSTRFF
jgi:hypothetical protein